MGVLGTVLIVLGVALAFLSIGGFLEYVRGRERLWRPCLVLILGLMLVVIGWEVMP